ncbi:exopolysaccharide biosynthesis protein [Qipengyuania zhejiangensis]|uniref:exopolysaccharide biosynthesis protein n=1 Tax=Qipengyuania zhejiangensis TaxID=3077782 RepID=UPI002D79AC2F|nr:exopolysaccharide biosynthesis protein [Qipengyuania sp. Z2]
MQKQPESVGEVLGELDELAAARENVCIADVLDDFGGRSFGPFIMLPALMELSPIGGIPGVPTFLALIVALVAAQLLVGKEHVWMPDFIQRRAVTGKNLHKAVTKLRGVGAFMDRHSEGRLEALTQGPAIKIVAIAILMLCCTVPPLEFLPFASSIPMLAIAILGLALTVRDGGMVLASLIFTIAASAAGGYMLFNSDMANAFTG